MKLKSFKIVKIYLMIKIKFYQENFCIKFYFATIFSVPSTFYEKREDSGSVLVTKGSGGVRPKNTWILRIRNAEEKYFKCTGIYINALQQKF
jgi:hypothetical protein